MEPINCESEVESLIVVTSRTAVLVVVIDTFRVVQCRALLITDRAGSWFTYRITVATETISARSLKGTLLRGGYFWRSGVSSQSVGYDTIVFLTRLMQ